MLIIRVSRVIQVVAACGKGWKMKFVSWGVVMLYEYHVSCVIWVCLECVEGSGDSVLVSMVVDYGLL